MNPKSRAVVERIEARGDQATPRQAELARQARETEAAEKAVTAAEVAEDRQL